MSSVRFFRTDQPAELAKSRFGPWLLPAAPGLDGDLAASGAGAFSATGVLGQSADLAAGGIGAFSAAGIITTPSDFSASGIGVFAAVGALVLPGVLSAAASSDFAAVGELIDTGIDGDLAAGATGAFAAVGVIVLPGVLSAAGAGSFSALGVGPIDAVLVTAGSSSFIAIGSVSSGTGPLKRGKTMLLLKQSTQTVVQFGPILGTDFLTVQTGVSLSSGTAELYKAGGTSAVQIHGNTWAHINGGIYALTLTASNLDTVGPLLIHIHAGSTQPQSVQACVLPATTYDALIGGGALPADVTKINGSANAGANISQAALGQVLLTIQSGATTTSIPTNLTQTANNFYVGRTLIITSGLTQGEAGTITAYNGTTKVLTVNALTSAPGALVTAVIV